MNVAAQRKPAAGELEDVTPVVAAEEISVRYPLGEELALDRVTFTLWPGELVALIGPNGAGKSTLFKILSGVNRRYSGTLGVDGTTLLRKQKENFIAYMPQEGDIDWDYPILVKDVVKLGLYGSIRRMSLGRLFSMGDYPASHNVLAMNALQTVEMEAFAHRDIKALSGGQKKRVFLARALAQEARLLLLDEPLSGVDQRSEAVIMNVLTKMAEAGATVLMASHDIAGARHYADRVLLLNKRIIQMGPPESVITEPLIRQAFGRSLHFL